MNWAQNPRRHCKGYPVETFFPKDVPQAKAAKAICDGCPVKAECLQSALTDSSGEYSTFGVWGGTTAEERRYMIVTMERSQLSPIQAKNRDTHADELERLLTAALARLGAA